MWCARRVRARLFRSEAASRAAFLFGWRTGEKPGPHARMLGFLARAREQSAGRCLLRSSPAPVCRDGFPRASQAEALPIAGIPDLPSHFGRIASVPILDP